MMIVLSTRHLSETAQRLAESRAQLGDATQELSAANEDAARKGEELARISDELQREQERSRNQERADKEAIDHLVLERDKLLHSLARLREGLESAHAAQRVKLPTANAACDAMPLPSAPKTLEAESKDEEAASANPILDKVATQIGTKVRSWVPLVWGQRRRRRRRRRRV